MKSIRAALSSSTCSRTWRYIGATAARRFRRFYKHRLAGVRRQIAAILPPNVRSAIYTLPMNRQAVKLTKWSAEQFLRSQRLNLPHTRTRKNVPDCHRYHLQLFLGGGVLWWTCLSVCVFVCPRTYLRNVLLVFTKACLHVTYGHGSILFRWSCDMQAYFRLCGWRHVRTKWPGRGDAKGVLIYSPGGSTDLTPWRILKLTHYGALSLMSAIALFVSEADTLWLELSTFICLPLVFIFS